VLKVVAPAIAVALGAVTVALLLKTGSSHAESTSPSTPTPQTMAASNLPSIEAEAAPPPFRMPTDTAMEESRDQRFLGLVTQAVVVIGDRAGVIADGHRICGVMDSTGYTVSQMTVGIANNTPGWANRADQVRGVAEAAVTVYCPEFEDRQ
jgi:hypothetical protein